MVIKAKRHRMKYYLKNISTICHSLIDYDDSEKLFSQLELHITVREPIWYARRACLPTLARRVTVDIPTSSKSCVRQLMLINHADLFLHAIFPLIYNNSGLYFCYPDLK